MPFPIVIPRLGWSMEQGTFVAWLKRDGDLVRPGDALFELEGEKALQEVEAVDEGVLRIDPKGPQPGDIVTVGAVLGYLLAEGESLPQTPAESHQQSSVPVKVQPEAIVEIAIEVASRADATPGVEPPARPVASPRARHVASELGVDWKPLTGSGAGGRIRERDVRTAAADITRSPAKGQRIELSQHRRAIAMRLGASRRETIPVTLTTRADATALVQLRNAWRERATDPLPGFQDVILQQLAAALAEHSSLAGRWDGDMIVRPDPAAIGIGIAVDTDRGLVTPVVRRVPKLSLAQIAAESQRLIGLAKAGRLESADMEGSHFTVTNLGAFGIDAFTPVINFSELAILGLGTIRKELTVNESGDVATRSLMTLSLTFDHRATDGAPAARFLQNIAARITDIRDQDLV